MRSSVRMTLVTIFIVSIFALLLTLWADPTFADPYTKPGTYVKFTVKLNRGLLADPNVEKVSAEPALLSFSSAILDSKVKIKIGGYKEIETSSWQSSYGGGSGIVSATTFIPDGDYQVQFQLYNKGGEMCNPISGCTWVLDDTIVRTLSVKHGSVRLI